MELLIPLLLLVLAIPLVVTLMRANELFCLRWDGKRLAIVRGRLPKRLLDDFVEILGSEPTAPLTLRGVVEDRDARIYPDGELSSAQKQRIRNGVGQWPGAKIRAALDAKKG